VDGAGALAIFRNITLPGLRPTLLFVGVTTIINTFRVFGQILVMTNGGPFDSTRPIVQHIYETAFGEADYYGPLAKAQATETFIQHTAEIINDAVGASRSIGIALDE
jgi:ABC-type sugar transport system permease subunit